MGIAALNLSYGLIIPNGYQGPLLGPLPGFMAASQIIRRLFVTALIGAQEMANQLTVSGAEPAPVRSGGGACEGFGVVVGRMG